MLEYIAVVLLILAVYAYYRLFILPPKIMKNYASLFEQAGYRVLLQPYALLGRPVIDRYFKSIENYNEPFYYDKN